MWWQDAETDEDQGHVRHLPAREMLARVGPLFRPHVGSVVAGLLLLVVAVVAEIGGPLVLRHLIDEDIGGGSRDGIVRSALLYAALFVVATIANWFQVAVLSRMGLAVVTELKERVFAHLLGLSSSYFDGKSPGRLMARVESDTERLQMLFSEVGIAVLRTALLLGGVLVVMLVSNWRVTVGLALFAAPIAWGTVVWFQWMRGLYRALRSSVAKISGFVAEYVPAVPIVQVFGYERHASARLEELNDEKVRIERRSSLYQYGFWGLLTAVEVVAVLLLLHLGSGQWLDFTLTVGTLILFVEYARRIFRPLAMFSEQLAFIQRAFASADRVFAVLDTPTATPDAPDARADVPDWSEVAFDDVSFTYADGTQALDGVSFRIRRGERVALVGLSGGGKSTITHLLLRFYDPTAGRVTVDGVDLRSFAKHAWRERVGLVQQDIHLFPGTARDNLAALVDGFDDERILGAARTVGADEVLARLPEGLDEPLSEGGTNLSMGERQLLSFARALVPDPELLVLDEATSSVDPGTERRLQESMDRLLSGRTALVVAHRLATVVRADRILVVHQGRIVERGTHAELLAAGGVYSDLFELQFRSPGAA